MRQQKHLEMGGWNTRPSFWDGLFSGVNWVNSLLVSGSVSGDMKVTAMKEAIVMMSFVGWPKCTSENCRI